MTVQQDMGQVHGQHIVAARPMQHDQSNRVFVLEIDRLRGELKYGAQQVSVGIRVDGLLSDLPALSACWHPRRTGGPYQSSGDQRPTCGQSIGGVLELGHLDPTAEIDVDLPLDSRDPVASRPALRREHHIIESSERNGPHGWRC